MKGSFQPVPRRVYEAYGLDLQKQYFTFYVPSNVFDISRDRSGDQITFRGFRYQCESNNDWFAEDGWKGVLCVMIGPDDSYQPAFGFNTIPLKNPYNNFGFGNFIPGET